MIQILHFYIAIPDDVQGGPRETAAAHAQANEILVDLQRRRPGLEVVGTQLTLELEGGRRGKLATLTGFWSLTVTVRYPSGVEKA